MVKMRDVGIVMSEKECQEFSGSIFSVMMKHCISLSDLNLYLNESFSCEIHVVETSLEFGAGSGIFI